MLFTCFFCVVTHIGNRAVMLFGGDDSEGAAI